MCSPSAELNRLTLYLSPVVLVVLLGYSYMKRVTRWSHLVLGLALGLAPSAAWIAVRGSLDPRIVVLTAAVTLWVGGFDVLYACQDFEHDRAAGLHSLPQVVGIPAAFWAARVMHLAMLGLLVWFGCLFSFGIAGWLGVAAAGLLLAYEHSIVSPRDLRRLNAAFFTMNGVIAMVFLALWPPMCGCGDKYDAMRDDAIPKDALSCGMVPESSLSSQPPLQTPATRTTGEAGTGMKIAIQGEPGSFSHEAAMKLVPDAVDRSLLRSRPMCLPRWRTERSTRAVIPIENSLAGSVLEHFDLLLHHDVKVERETLLRIRHNLIAISDRRSTTSTACFRIRWRWRSAGAFSPRIRGWSRSPFTTRRAA